MQVSEAKDWVWIANTIITLILLVGGWFVSRRKATSDEIQKVADSTGKRLTTLEKATITRVDQLENRLIVAEKNIEAMPTHADLVKQYRQMERQTEKLDQLIGKMNAREKLLDSIHEHLLKGGEPK